MSNEFDKYKSISFKGYFEKYRAVSIIFDNENNLLKLINESGEVIIIVYYSKSINHTVTTDILLNSPLENHKFAYFVYENGTQGKDWIWCYADLISVEELFK